MRIGVNRGIMWAPDRGGGSATERTNRNLVYPAALQRVVPNLLKSNIFTFIDRLPLVHKSYNQGQPDLTAHVIRMDIKLTLGEKLTLDEREKLRGYLTGEHAELVAEAAVVCAKLGDATEAINAVGRFYNNEKKDDDLFCQRKLVGAIEIISELSGVTEAHYEELINFTEKLMEKMKKARKDKQDVYTREEFLMVYLNILGNIGGDRAASKVGPYLQSQDEGVRITAAAALFKMKQNIGGAVNVAIELLNNNIEGTQIGDTYLFNHDGPLVRLAAARVVGLSGNTDAAEKALVPLGIQASETLGEIGKKDTALGLLRKSLQGTQGNVRLQNLVQMYKLGDKTVLTGIKDLLREEIKKDYEMNHGGAALFELLPQLASVHSSEVFEHFKLFENFKNIDSFDILCQIRRYILGFEEERQ